jgi:hypothetical protein
MVFKKSFKSFVSIYNVEVTENKTNYDFGKKATLNQIELNKKSKTMLISDFFKLISN